MSQTDGLEGNIVTGGLRFRQSRRVKSSNLASHAGHHLLEAPIVGDAEGVDEALVPANVLVEFVETDELLPVEVTAVAEPFAADLFAHGAHGLQRLAGYLTVKMIC